VIERLRVEHSSLSTNPCGSVVACAADDIFRQQIETLWNEQRSAIADASRDKAHDIRTKLTAVLGNASLIVRSDDASSIHRWAERISEAAAGIRVLCDDVSELGSTRYPSEAAGVFPDHVTRELADMINDLVGDDGAVVVASTEGATEAVRLNPAAIRAMVAALVWRLNGGPVQLQVTSRVGASGGQARLLTWTASPVGPRNPHPSFASPESIGPRMSALVRDAIGSDIRYVDGLASCEVVAEAVG
jgi:hypothetical protein